MLNITSLYEMRTNTNRLLFKKRLSTIHIKQKENVTEFLDKYITFVEELAPIG